MAMWRIGWMGMALALLCVAVTPAGAESGPGGDVWFGSGCEAAVTLPADTWARVTGPATQTDDLWRTLRGDSGVSADPATTASVGLTRAAVRPRDCFDDYEASVLRAWSWYEGCYYDFSWWSGGREACAAVWIIRVESAWSHFVGCSIVGLR
jgi:hypothetical protein